MLAARQARNRKRAVDALDERRAALGGRCSAFGIRRTVFGVRHSATVFGVGVGV
jgi:hypothetical protein